MRVCDCALSCCRFVPWFKGPFHSRSPPLLGDAEFVPTDPPPPRARLCIFVASGWRFTPGLHTFNPSHIPAQTCSFGLQTVLHMSKTDLDSYWGRITGLKT